MSSYFDFGSALIQILNLLFFVYVIFLIIYLPLKLHRSHNDVRSRLETIEQLVNNIDK